jgi:hypothetical protein
LGFWRLLLLNLKLYGRDRMKLYLDMCSLQRPLDDKGQLRILLESEAVLGILGLIEKGKISLASSDALLFENSANPNEIRRDFAGQVLNKSRFFIQADAEVEKLAKEYVLAGISSLDALHLASAVVGKCDCFCSCDDKLMKKARSILPVGLQVKTPLELAVELDP